MTKKILLAVVSCLILLSAVMLVRTARFTSRQVSVEPAPQVAVDEAKAAANLAQSLRFQTVSHSDAAQSSRDAFLALHAFLERTYPKVHSALTRETVGDYSLLYTWKGREEGLKPVVLLAHTDVVPVEPGTEASWAYPPFEGRVADEFVWGRGAWDDKAGVVGILEAVEMLLGEGFQPRRTVYLAFGHDEELGGPRGAVKIVELLQSRGVAPEFVLDEGGAITEGLVPGVGSPV
ncbi:MAG: M20/M25/M40 family metallo-hydrolase, partial [Pyrinomonadaceae bacterium]